MIILLFVVKNNTDSPFQDPRKYPCGSRVAPTREGAPTPLSQAPLVASRSSGQATVVASRPAAVASRQPALGAVVAYISVFSVPTAVGELSSEPSSYIFVGSNEQIPWGLPANTLEYGRRDFRGGLRSYSSRLRKLPHHAI